MDQFYAMVTGEEEAFYEMCMVLPEVIRNVVSSLDDATVPCDTVMDELKTWASHLDADTEEIALAMAVYMLGFRGYNGFR